MSERKKKPEPEREGPRRDPSGAFGGAGAAFDGLRAAGEAWREVVERSVRMGYRIVEEQIEQGRKVAGSLNDQVYGSGRTRDDVGDITDRVFTSFADMTARWFDMMGSMASGLAWPATAAGATPGGVGVAVRGSRAVKVTLELGAGCGRKALRVEPLRRSRGEGELTVKLQAGLAPGLPVIEVQDPGEAPDGIYRGRILEGENGAEVGTLQVRLGS